MKDLSTCQVCEGKLWKSKHKYYNGTYQMPEIIKLDKETGKKFLNKMVNELRESFVFPEEYVLSGTK